MVSRRLERWIRSSYSANSADAVIAQLGQLAGQPDEFGRQTPERMEAALVFVGDGDLDKFRAAVDLLRVDWRDVLVSGGLGEPSWPEDLDRRLGRD